MKKHIAPIDFIPYSITADVLESHELIFRALERVSVVVNHKNAI